MKKKIAIVCQRYGMEVNGGAEFFARELAEHLNINNNVTVLTTKAMDHMSWKNQYMENEEVINGVAVKRFEVKFKRNLFIFKFVDKISRIFKCTFIENLLLVVQGPYVPRLVKYIKMNKGMYDRFIFITYLYYPTVKGIEHVFNKSVLIPTAHDERYIYMNIYKKMFNNVKAIAYLTNEEQRMVNDIFNNIKQSSAVVGVGIDKKAISVNDIEDFKKKYDIESKYLLYIGRIDEAKGCKELIKMFLKLLDIDMNLKLVLVGNKSIDIPEVEQIIYTGYVDEKEKWCAISGAEALVMPSNYESLSLVVLEAMAQGTKIIVNGNCGVLKQHCLKSGVGYYYNDYDEFVECVKNLKLIEKDEYQKKAIKYINDNYNWSNCIRKLEDLF